MPQIIADNLTADGYAVDVAGDRNETLSRLRVIAPDLIVVDVNGNTLGLIDTLRNGDDSLLAATADTPVIVLTSQPEELHRVRLLERGGDDVILKPFSYPELRARVTAVLRRTAPRQRHPGAHCRQPAHRHAHPGGHRRRAGGRALGPGVSAALRPGGRAHARVHPPRADGHHLGLQQPAGTHAGQPRKCGTAPASLRQPHRSASTTAAARSS
jgi:CheY-like chemotaxis protein